MKYFEWIIDPKNPSDRWIIVGKDKKDRYEGWAYNETFMTSVSFIVTLRPFLGYEKTSSPPVEILEKIIIDTFRRPW